MEPMLVPTRFEHRRFRPVRPFQGRDVVPSVLAWWQSEFDRRAGSSWNWRYATLAVYAEARFVVALLGYFAVTALAQARSSGVPTQTYHPKLRRSHLLLKRDFCSRAERGSVGIPPSPVVRAICE
ncbi:hypothetical protein RHA1_ro08927 (plasmid) [Rhodococcus jostii RHA1]|uniref:Uncharacterized protein n=1 Tax=Rhodococcus jostii (strain RHA1) TaxID=101510 RepID=Q0RXL5_RHOJR|nr:hypothetical protein RHA1_ro08927 [Rhodococcus jostii RHA1]